jgi:hypothetical protein
MSNHQPTNKSIGFEMSLYRVISGRACDVLEPLTVDCRLMGSELSFPNVPQIDDLFMVYLK